MEITVTTKVEIKDSDLCAPPAEVGQWMADAAIRVWFGYDDSGTFTYNRVHVESSGETYYSCSDIDENKTVEFTATQFFEKHVALIWLGTIEGYRHDWIDFAFRSKGAPADEYDDNTVDAVFQNMLYGTIVYG